MLCWQRGGPKDGGGMRGHSPTPRLARPLVGRGLGGLKSCEGCARSFVAPPDAHTLPTSSRGSSRAASQRLSTIETHSNSFSKQLGEGARPPQGCSRRPAAKALSALVRFTPEPSSFFLPPQVGSPRSSSDFCICIQAAAACWWPRRLGARRQAPPPPLLVRAVPRLACAAAADVC